MEKKEIVKQETVSSDIATVMIQNAIDRGLDVATIEKLLELRDKIQKEITRQQFINALSNFQSEIPEIPKDKIIYNKDGSIRYKYTSFDNIVKTIKPLLSKYGLSFRFETSFEKNMITVHCIIQHSNGHFEKTSFSLPVDPSPHMSPIQQYGSTITYAKRYALSLALGLATEEDTDALEVAKTETKHKEETSERGKKYGNSEPF